jgi:uncharacterized RDD family membrane protein YckC
MIDIRMRRGLTASPGLLPPLKALAQQAAPQIRRLLLAVLLAANATGVSAQPPDNVEADAQTDIIGAAAPDDVEPESTFVYHPPVIRVGGDHTVERGQEVSDVVVVMGNVRISGHAHRDVVVVFGTASIDTTAVIDGSLVIVGGHASIGANASVGRDLLVFGGSVDAEPGFIPGGEHVVVDPRAFGINVEAIVPWITQGLLWGRPLVPSLPWLWFVVGAFFVTYLVLALALERPVRRSADTIAAKPVSTFITGLVVLMLIAPIGLLLAATVIGVVVIPFAICGLLVAWLIGKAGVLRWIGMRLAPEQRDAEGVASRSVVLRSVLFGAAIVTVAYTIPIVGFLTWGIGGIMALGTAVLTIRDGYRRENPYTPRTLLRRTAAASAPAPAPAASVPTEPITAAHMSAKGGAAGASIIAEPPVMSYQPDSSSTTTFTPAPAMPEAPALTAFPAASFLERLAAFALDLIVVVIGARALDLLYEPFDRRFILLLVLYHIAFWATKGTTVGGMICNLRVVKLDGQPLRPAEALVRGVAGVLSGAVAGLGFLWMLKDPHRETWHDKIAGTQVIKVPRNYPV